MGALDRWNKGGYGDKQSAPKRKRTGNSKLPEFRNTIPRSFVATKRKEATIISEVVFDRKLGKYVDREISRSGERHGHIGGYKLEKEVDQEYYAKLERFTESLKHRNHGNLTTCSCGLDDPTTNGSTLEEARLRAIALIQAKHDF
ncbi:hypothetical protein KAR91_84230 [Candidatus Pacearchaeota archaeon]|nr:hypothetical protein [Candidatus Pacearchaeota archaeon]